MGYDVASLAIVILNWNGQDMLRRFLPSVLKYSAGADVFVADNGSSDDSVKVLKEEFPEAGLIVLERNFGFAEGYNRALSTLSGYRYYLLLNSDVEVREGWLNAMVSYMEEHTDVAACQPKILCQWRPTHFEYAGAAGGYIDALGYPYCRGRIFNTVEEDHGQYDTVADVHWASGAALMVRSEDYWEVGGLDGRFFAHQEEIDLCLRLLRKGKRVVCVPTSVVYHLGGGTLPQNNPRKTYLNFRNNMWLLKKNLPKSTYRIVMLARFFLDGIAALQMLLTGQYHASMAVSKGRRDAFRERGVKCEVVGKDDIGMRPGCLLWSYYIRGKKKYSEL